MTHCPHIRDNQAITDNSLVINRVTTKHGMPNIFCEMGFGNVHVFHVLFLFEKTTVQIS